jgi:hypothetical protein
MKSAPRLLALGFVSLGLVGSACVSGDTVAGGTGGKSGGNGGLGGSNGGLGGSNGGLGGSNGGLGGSNGGLGGSNGGLGGSNGGLGGSNGGLGGTPGGGLAGSSGSVNGCPRTAVLIDNFDEAPRGGPPTGGFFNVNCGVGAWYVYGDPSAPPATVTPAFSSVTPFVSSTPGNGGAGYAAHINGSGYAIYGLGLGVNINSSGTTIKPYNASAYSGITFWAMGTSTAAEGTNMVRVAIPTSSSSTPANGGTCVAVAPGYCDGHWGKVIALNPTTWTQVTIKWSELTKDVNAIATAFDPATVIGVHWQAGGSAATTTTAAVAAGMNMWIDDLAFVP